MRIAEYLTENRVPFERLLHPPAFTATKLAKYLRVSGRHVVKSILLMGPAGPILAVLPATRKIDLKRLDEQFGGPVRLARSVEMETLFGDCEPGTLVPFGKLYGIPTLLDAFVPADAQIIFEAQFHAIAIRMACQDYLNVEQPMRLAFASDTPSFETQPIAG